MPKIQHILLIDPLEKLVTKKDSSLMLALSLKARGIPVGLLFLADLFWSNQENSTLKVYDFDGAINPETFYLDSFHLGHAQEWQVNKYVIIHMRLDPPFDARYLRTLWLLQALQGTGARVLNDPMGIARYNEKITALEHSSSLPSFVGNSTEALAAYLDSYPELEREEFAIIKPLDMFQGYGVVKVPARRQDMLQAFAAEMIKSGTPLIVQPFAKKVESGETRAIFFKGQELGSILKVPQAGQFLANIAQGASYRPVDLTAGQKRHCLDICNRVATDGVDWVAFDLLGDAVSEVNVTCPGLLVEVSNALKRNLANDLIDFMTI